MTDQRSAFEARKHQVVSSLVEALDPERRDKSPKGFIDAPILDLIHIINEHPDYYTTSSCSGRVAIYCEGLEDDADTTTTKGGTWLYVTHDPVDIPENVDNDWILRLLFGQERDRVELGMACDEDIKSLMNKQMIYFKFEPMILHVESSSLEASMRLNSLAFQSGYQNSGITPSRTREMLAIRSTHKLDTPIAYIQPSTKKIRCIVDPSYLLLLMHMSNDKFEQNADRMKLFEETMKKEVAAKKSELAMETKEQRKERKRREGLARREALAKSDTQNNSTQLDAIDMGSLSLE